MFTGIIEETGRVQSVRRSGTLTRLEIAADKAADRTKIGDSVAIDGACLTVVAINGRALAFEVVAETVRMTTLKKLRSGSAVNLERALKVGDRLGGHFVTGHVDGVGVIRSKRGSRGNLEFHIGVPAGLRRYLVSKGSVAVDGISLTIAALRQGGFTVAVIPHTAAMTTLGAKGSGDEVNIELDILAKRPSI